MLLLDYLAASPAALILVCVLFGLLVGSFLNVVIHRIPKMMEATWRQEARELLEQPAPCLLYTSPSPRDKRQSRMPSSA